MSRQSWQVREGMQTKQERQGRACIPGMKGRVGQAARIERKYI